METYRTVTFEEIWKSEEVNAYIKNGNDNLGVIGFTEHGLAMQNAVRMLPGRYCKA